MRPTIILCLVLAGCATPRYAQIEHATGIARSSCGAAEGGAMHLALDTGSDFVLIWADGSWGDGGEAGWRLEPDSLADGFSVRICGASGGECRTPSRAHFVIESTSRSSVSGTLTYETVVAKREFAFTAVRTDQGKQFALCG